MALDGLRSIRDEDRDGIVALVSEAYAEYPGCVLDLDGVDADLDDLAGVLGRTGGGGWVVEREGVILGCVGWVPSGPESAELERLYVDKTARHAGMGSGLVETVIETVTANGVRWLDLWSDTRFKPAHRLYRHLGFTRLPETRQLHDPSKTTEFHFAVDLRNRVAPGS